jgi:hypothetical protein
MKTDRDSLTVVVRSASERTEELCVSSIRAQSAAEVTLIRERPFLSALRTSIRLGIEGAREFTLCVDADIVLAPGAIARMLTHLRAAPGAFFACGSLLDRYYGEPKLRGTHLYRTRFLEEAALAIPNSEAVERPETAMKNVLLGRGRTSVFINDRLLGLHGYGQYYADTFRTIACRGQKSREQFMWLMERFAQGSAHDIDLRVALWALTESVDSDFSLDAGHWRERFDRIRLASGLAERQEMSHGEARRLRALASATALPPIGFWRLRRRLRRMRGKL